ncbi:hypothetical protein [Bacillus sp. V5-8f]|uniref:hypothetical protein n=1 Tax=Bacillus sp. V5-8f TaxID=2053044 RepID=UPI0026B1ADB4|nr:hypothetical protein [Bacillus sp. V5-8f]
MIIIGGENIYAAEVEGALYKHDDIPEGAVVGVAAQEWGESVKSLRWAKEREESH